MICLTSVKLSVVSKAVGLYTLSFPPPHSIDREILSAKEEKYRKMSYELEKW